MAISRRTALKGLTATGAGTLLASDEVASRDAAIQIAGRPVELVAAAVGPRIVRISVAPIENGRPRPTPSDGSLVEQRWGPASARLTTLAEPRSFSCGVSRVTISREPLTIRVDDADGRLVQRIRLDEQAG